MTHFFFLINKGKQFPSDYIENMLNSIDIDKNGKISLGNVNIYNYFFKLKCGRN